MTCQRASVPAIQAYVEEHLLHWPGVAKRKIFGHDGYYVEGRLFAFIGDRGIVLKPPTDEKAAAPRARRRGRLVARSRRGSEQGKLDRNPLWR